MLICSLHLESIVDLEGKVTAAPEKITGCTQQDVELQVCKVMMSYYITVSVMMSHYIISTRCSVSARPSLNYHYR